MKSEGRATARQLDGRATARQLDSGATARQINRHALVRRHNPHRRDNDPFSALSVGNGEFAFTADITGLQTFPQDYESGIPLCTMAQWAWHSSPPPVSSGGSGDSGTPAAYSVFDEHGLGLAPHFNGERELYYASDSRGQRELFDWLRQNPHRLHLGRIGLDLRAGNHEAAGDGAQNASPDAAPGLAATFADIKNPSQVLDLWTGCLQSEFEYDGQIIRVETFCHPVRDLLYFAIEIPGGSFSGLPGVVLAFPYGSPQKNAADWQYAGPNHRTVCARTRGSAGDRLEFQRFVDNDRVFANFECSSPYTSEETGPHTWKIRFDPDAPGYSVKHAQDYPAKVLRVECAVEFSPRSGTEAIPSYETAKFETRAYWENFWSRGGAIDFSAVSDPRAFELERRVVLSQYLCAIQCAGSLPPAETGLTCNSWYGKFHLEMHVWHSAHFVLWGRTALFEKSLWYYASILEPARERARLQGYRGARWPKMTEPAGRDSPSHIGPFLIWQQPHPIFYAELLYSTGQAPEILERYRDIVFETAEFMASYARYDAKTDRFVLGPALIPAQENHDPKDVLNPAFELAYWQFGLQAAQTWRERLGVPREPAWQNVLDKLSPLPQAGGCYLSHERCPDSYGVFAKDHPAMLAACGFLPGAMSDLAVMRRSFDRVLRTWDMESLWGWDFPFMAMTAARLGDGGAAVDMLLMETPKNTFLPNGHNRQKGDEALPVYLPGNGALLLAVAMMAAGGQGCETRPNPGFPKNWRIEWEGLACMP